MADVKIRNLDDEVVASIRRQAEQAGRSLEQELRRIVTDEHRRRREALLADILAHQTSSRQRESTLVDSAELIREDRDARG
jgi:plasmid stability protein